MCMFVILFDLRLLVIQCDCHWSQLKASYLLNYLLIYSYQVMISGLAFAVSSPDELLVAQPFNCTHQLKGGGELNPGLNPLRA